MANRDSFKPVLNPPKDYTMIATAQSEAALPFSARSGDTSPTPDSPNRVSISRMRKATERSIARNCIRASVVKGKRNARN